MADTYKKRAGTSGISGQLYETKLITLLEFRLLHDSTIEQFHLASNIDEIGAFDDVCLKIKAHGLERPILAFLQAKHKEDDDTLLKYDLIKNFHFSLLKVKQKFNCKSREVIFDGKFEDVDCVFLLYTNAKYCNDLNKDSEQDQKTVGHQTRKLYESPFSKVLNDLIATGVRAPQAVQLDHSQNDIDIISSTVLEEEIITLAEHFSKFLNSRNNQSNILNDEYMERYHVILARTIVYFPDIPEGDNATSKEKPTQVKEWQWCAFRDDFFYSNDNIIRILRNKIYELVIKNKGNTKKTKGAEKVNNAIVPDYLINDLISSFLSTPSAMTLSYLIETHITHVNDTLEFAIERPSIELEKLQHIQISKSTIDEAKSLAAARNMLKSLNIKVPIHFGNIDLKMKKLSYLTNAFIDLCKNFVIKDQYRFVTIDDNIKEALLSSNGGIGGAVGNLLVYDTKTKCLKFVKDDDENENEKNTKLPNNAQTLMESLKKEMGDLDIYRFKVTAHKFPRLVFDCSEEAEGILSKLLIYEQQSNHHGVEKILHNLIKLLYPAHSDTQDLPVKSDILLIYYHHEVQKWWMAQKSGTYLNKSSNKFHEVKNTIALEPQMSALQVMYMTSKIKYFGYSFCESAFISFDSVKNLQRIVIVTNIATLTTVKVIQCLKNKYTILDFECMLNLPEERFSAIINELKQTEKSMIIVCEALKGGKLMHRALEQLSLAVEKKNVIVITKNEFLDTVQDYFSNEIVLDERNTTLSDLTIDSQKDIIENTKVIFQGQEINLKLIMSNDTLTCIKGSVLDKIIHNQRIELGESLTDKKYEEIRHLYVERRICRSFNDISSRDSVLKKDYNEYDDRYLVKTFHDINDDAVLLTAKPGMGKSTLLTHLSVNTKERDRLRWIVRINLLEYSEVFYNWLQQRTVIDTALTLKFICHVVLKNKEPISLKLIKGKAYAENCAKDEWFTFKLNMLLNSYNKRKLIVLFDGFDEICPHYKDVVLNFFSVLLNYRRRIKIWVTSRPYSQILPDLEAHFGKSYEIEYINAIEQRTYLEKYWQMKLDFENLSEMQLSNIKLFIDVQGGRPEFMSALDGIFAKVFDHFDHYLRWHFPHVTDIILSHKSSSNNTDSDTSCSEDLETSSEEDDKIRKLLADLGEPDFNVATTSKYDENINKDEREIFETEVSDIDKSLSSFRIENENTDTESLFSESEKQVSDTESSKSDYMFRWSKYSLDLETSDTDRLDLDIFFSETNDTINFPAAPKSGNKSKQVSKFLGTPLLLHLVADYFVNIIDAGDTRIITDINLPAIYKMFIETKLKKILFEDKNKMDVHYPDIITRYERDLTECINLHKKLGAFAIFGNPLFSRQFSFDDLNDIGPFEDRDLLEFEAMTKRIRNGTEKTGFISYVTTDNIPIFVHRTFAEYFATHFIIDVFKNEKVEFDVKKHIFGILEDCNSFSSIYSWIMKIKRMDSHLDSIVKNMESKLLRIFSRSCREMFTNVEFKEEHWLRLYCSSPEDYDNDFFNLLEYDNFIQNVKTNDDCIREIEDNIIENMKPRLKRYFQSKTDRS